MWVAKGFLNIRAFQRYQNLSHVKHTTKDITVKVTIGGEIQFLRSRPSLVNFDIFSHLTSFQAKTLFKQGFEYVLRTSETRYGCLKGS